MLSFPEKAALSSKAPLSDVFPSASFIVSIAVLLKNVKLNFTCVSMSHNHTSQI